MSAIITIHLHLITMESGNMHCCPKGFSQYIIDPGFVVRYKHLTSMSSCGSEKACRSVDLEGESDGELTLTKESKLTDGGSKQTEPPTHYTYIYEPASQLIGPWETQEDQPGCPIYDSIGRTDRLPNPVQNKDMLISDTETSTAVKNEPVASVSQPVNQTDESIEQRDQPVSQTSRSQGQTEASSTRIRQEVTGETSNVLGMFCVTCFWLLVLLKYIIQMLLVLHYLG